MKQLALLAIWLALPMFGVSQEQSLADLARKTRAEKKTAAVVDNITVDNQTHLKPSKDAPKVALESTVFATPDKPKRAEASSPRANSEPSAVVRSDNRAPLDSGFGKVSNIGSYNTNRPTGGNKKE